MSRVQRQAGEGYGKAKTPSSPSRGNLEGRPRCGGTARISRVSGAATSVLAVHEEAARASAPRPSVSSFATMTSSYGPGCASPTGTRSCGRASRRGPGRFAKSRRELVEPPRLRHLEVLHEDRGRGDLSRRRGPDLDRRSPKRARVQPDSDNDKTEKRLTWCPVRPNYEFQLHHLLRHKVGPSAAPLSR